MLNTIMKWRGHTVEHLSLLYIKRTLFLYIYFYFFSLFFFSAFKLNIKMNFFCTVAVAAATYMLLFLRAFSSPYPLPVRYCTIITLN